MCKTIKDFANIISCTLQFIARTMMTILLMLESMMRLIMSGFYNILSFLLQCISLLPICLVFFITSKLKCSVCGSGGMCGAARGGACDCIMSAVAVMILFMILKSVGIVDNIFYGLGYQKGNKTNSTGKSLRSWEDVGAVPLSALPYVVTELSIASLDDEDYYGHTTEEEHDYYETNEEDQTQMEFITTTMNEEQLGNSSEDILTTRQIAFSRIMQNGEFTTFAYYFV